MAIPFELIVLLQHFYFVAEWSGEHKTTIRHKENARATQKDYETGWVQMQSRK